MINTRMLQLEEERNERLRKKLSIIKSTIYN